MIKVNRQAKSVLDKLTQGLDEPGDHRQIDNAPGAFMSVHIEHIGMCTLGAMFSVAHYYEQNGDLVKDPDMVFVRSKDGYYPIEFQQDNLAIYQCAVTWEGDKIKAYSQKMQKDMASFASSWMRNIKAQRGL